MRGIISCAFLAVLLCGSYAISSSPEVQEFVEEEYIIGVQAQTPNQPLFRLLQSGSLPAGCLIAFSTTSIYTGC